MPELSICLPAIRPDRWQKLYDSLLTACSAHDFELVLISPYNLPVSMQGLPNVKHIKEFGSATRATMLGSNFCTGKYIAVPADDGYFFPNSFDQALDYMANKPANDVMVLRYREGKNCDGKPLDNSYWLAKTHIDAASLHIQPDWLTASQPLLQLDFFRDFGGWDCNFEHVAFAAHDFSYRSQRCGSRHHLSPIEVMNADHSPGISGDHAPIHHGHIEHDQPFFTQMYKSPSVVGRTKIDFNNWMTSPTSWERRFPNRPKYDLSICIPGIRVGNWQQIYDSVIGSARRYNVQLVFVGPYDPPASILDNPHVKFLKDYGAPTRCVQMGSMLCEGNLFMWFSDDGIFVGKSLMRAIDLFGAEDNSRNEMIMRYTEGAGRTGQMPIDEYWRAKYHRDNHFLAVPEETKIAPLGMMGLSLFREMGGFDCRYEHINLSTHDLAFRIQKAGGKLIMSPQCVAHFDWNPNAPDYAPVRDSYLVNDLPLFRQEYSQPNSSIKLDFNNWRASPARWRRFA